MLQRKLPYPISNGGLLALVIVACVWLLPILSVQAQCGSQASSCKNCHEVQAELPVNNDGNGWHESHAFGDFCYICHAGNQQATEEEAAHAGMVPPLSDVEASCQMCHADDLTERAQVYASILGQDLNGGSPQSDSTNQSTDTSSDDFWGSEPASNSEPVQADIPVEPVPTVEQQDTECLALTHELIIDDASIQDYAQRYDEIVLGKHPVNMGNVVLGVLIGLLVIGGGGFIFLNEIRISTSHSITSTVEGEYPLDVIEMLPALTALKLQTRKALKRILSNPQKTDQILGLINTVISDEEPEEPIQ
jgi:hypothetical protein